MTDPIKDITQKLAPEVYKDLASPALSEIWSVAWRWTKALLAPLRWLLWWWEKIEEVVTEWVNERLKKTPEQNRKSPDPEIAVPIMQALTYTVQNETLREMYLNLLANAMDKTKDSVTHPSFVNLIKQMSSLDAKVFEKLSKRFEEYIPVLNPTIGTKGTNQFYPGITPWWFIGWIIEGYTIFDISASLVRLDKFWLIELMFDRTAWNKDKYKTLEQDTILQKILSDRIKITWEDLELKGTKSLLHINEYGKQFQLACK